MRWITIGMAIGLAGCEPADSTLPDTQDRPVDTDVSPEEPTPVEDRIEVAPNPRVDLLFVVHNNFNAALSQTALSDLAGTVFAALGQANMDAHVGVTSTDMDGTAGSNGTGGRLRTANGVHVIGTDTPQAAATFSEMVDMGTDGSFDERGLAAVQTAIDDLGESDNLGFYRSDATLHAVVVADDNEDGPTPTAFLAWLDDLKPRAEDRVLHALVSPIQGDDYAEVASATGGVVSSLLDSFDGPIDDVMDQVTDPAPPDEFFFSQVPQVDTVEIEIEADDGGLTLVAPEDWLYLATRQSVRLLGDPPQLGDTVVLSYLPARKAAKL